MASQPRYYLLSEENLDIERRAHVVDLQSVNVRFRLANIYARIEFDNDDDRPAPPEKTI